jgi:hypothetical protein
LTGSPNMVQQRAPFLHTQVCPGLYTCATLLFRHDLSVSPGNDSEGGSKSTTQMIQWELAGC